MQEKPRVAIVDDDPKLRKAVCEALQDANFSVLEASTGAELRQLLADDAIDLIVLEAALPGEDGLSLARFLREEHPRVAVMLVSAEADALDRIVGLEIGADDYLAKPFDLRELSARIRSVLRRTGRRAGADDPAAATHRVSFGRCLLDLTSKRLHGEQGEEIPLSKLEFALLKTFADHPRRVLSRDRLLDLAHDGGHEPYDRSIDIRIGRIRKKIERDPANPQAIRTVRGAGYIYVPEE
jgi:two-component system phosphate regulon response regulator OmpR